jgi:hypothetical protein
MTNKTNTNVESETVEQELVEETFEDEFDELEIDSLIPNMSSMSSISEITEPEKECIVKDEDVIDLYDEILQNCRKDRESVGEVLANFLDMVMNEGDASSASKEAIVNLLKINTDVNDKMAKIADLRTRMKLKEKDTFPRYLAAQQNNKVVIEGSKREMLKTINKLAQRKKNDKQDQ